SLQQLSQIVHRIAMKMGYPVGLVRHNNGALPRWILGRHAGRTLAGMTGLRLNTAYSKHKTTRAVTPVGAQRQCSEYIKGGNKLSRRTKLDALEQTGTHQCIVYQS